MEAFNFVVACEDHNAYYYDMRNMSRALNVFKDHVSAVMDVNFSPPVTRSLQVLMIRQLESIRPTRATQERYTTRGECSMCSKSNFPWILST